MSLFQELLATYYFLGHFWKYFEKFKEQKRKDSVVEI
jgi:hypothetical protein